jgi:glycosyltransferase involved in cell wall biosynthesis
VIIPAYNEAASVVRVVHGLEAACPGLSYVVVNDGSGDATPTICREQGFPLLDQCTNLGLTGAFGTGVRYAVRHGYDAVVQFDGDGQHRPEFIPSMLAKIADGYDIVIGSRFITNRKPHNLRMVGSAFIAGAIRATTGTRLTDPTSGMRAYSHRVMEAFATQANMTPEPDTVSHLIRSGARACEVPVRMDERQAGVSYLNAGTSVKYMLRMAVSILVVQPFRQSALAQGGRPCH